MMPFVPAPNPKGEREYHLRKRFESEWNALSKDERQGWFRRACAECGREPNPAKKEFGREFVDRMLDVYAWTLFAESCDPAEAKSIANAGWNTMADVDAGEVPVGGW